MTNWQSAPDHREIASIQNAHWLSAPSEKPFYRQFGDGKACQQQQRIEDQLSRDGRAFVPGAEKDGEYWKDDEYERQNDRAETLGEVVDEWLRRHRDTN